MTSPFAAVETVLRTYFDALYFCDTNKLTDVFHPQAIYATADETPLLYRTMDEYVPVVAARRSPASAGKSGATISMRSRSRARTRPGPGCAARSARAISSIS